MPSNPHPGKQSNTQASNLTPSPPPKKTQIKQKHKKTTTQKHTNKLKKNTTTTKTNKHTKKKKSYQIKLTTLLPLTPLQRTHTKKEHTQKKTKKLRDSKGRAQTFRTNKRIELKSEATTAAGEAEPIWPSPITAVTLLSADQSCKMCYVTLIFGKISNAFRRCGRWDAGVRGGMRWEM